MKLVYGLLCDYAVPGQGDKPVIVGVFDHAYVIRPTPADPVQTPQCFMHLKFEAHANAGENHTLTQRLVDPDGKVVFERESPIHFLQRPELGSLLAHVYVSIGRLPVAEYGTYEWETFVDGERMGSMPLVLLDPGKVPLFTT